MKRICVSKRLLFINILCLLWLPNFCDNKQNEVHNEGVQFEKNMPNVIGSTEDVSTMQEKEIYQHQQKVKAQIVKPNVEYVNNVEFKSINKIDASKLESLENLSPEKYRQQTITNLDSSRDEGASVRDEPLLKQENLSKRVGPSPATDSATLETPGKHFEGVTPQVGGVPEKSVQIPEEATIAINLDSRESTTIPKVKPAAPVNVKPVKSVLDDHLHHQPHYDGMPSFDEWKKMMLAEQQKGGQKVPSPTPFGKRISSQKRRRNYSSYECGAKIVSSNTEGEGTSRILNELVDEYMLNPCKAKIWFVIELCETVQATQIELANFELFSSCPKDFAVYSSDNFPTRDWVSLGTFTATEQRILQSFKLKQEGFGKFIKIELLSHYGTEYYCPLSVVRIFGTSMVDEYEEMETMANHVDAPLEDELDRLDIVIEDKRPTNLFGSATDAVMNIVKKAAQALGQHQASEEIKGNETEDQQNVTEAQLCTVVNQAQNKCAEVSLKTENDSISPHQFPIISSSMHRSLFRLLHRCDQCSSRIRYYSSAQPHCRFFQAALGPVFFQALCDWFKEHPVIIAEETSAHRNKLPSQSMDSSILPTKSPPPQVMRVAVENDMPWKKLISNESIPLGPIDLVSSANSTKSSVNVFPNMSTINNEVLEKDIPQMLPTTPLNETDKTTSTPQLSETIFPLHVTSETSNLASQVIPAETTIPDDKTILESQTTSPGDIDSSTVSDIFSDSDVDQITEIMSDTFFGSEDIGETITTTEIPPERTFDEFNGKVEPVSVSSTGQKESVFMRMSNRIKALEISTNLSSQYLEELSQRYRRQMEEMQRSFNRTVAILNDTAKKAAERDLKQQDVLNKLQLQVTNISQTVEMLQAERSALFSRMLEVHLCLMVMEVIIVTTIMSLCVRRISSSAGQISLPAKETVVATRVSKRRSSVDSCTPPVARKVKKRSASEEALNAGELLIIEPLPVLIDPMLKAKKKNRRRCRAIQRSNSNPTSASKSSQSASQLTTCNSSDTFKSAIGVVSHEASSRCENCNDNTCTVVKAPDRERRLNGAPFQNLTNGSVIRPHESHPDKKIAKGRERFSFKKFLKLQKRDSI